MRGFGHLAALAGRRARPAHLHVLHSADRGADDRARSGLRRLAALSDEPRRWQRGAAAALWREEGRARGRERRTSRRARRRGGRRGRCPRCSDRRPGAGRNPTEPDRTQEHRHETGCRNVRKGKAAAIAPGAGMAIVTIDIPAGRSWPVLSPRPPRTIRDWAWAMRPSRSSGPGMCWQARNAPRPRDDPRRRRDGRPAADARRGPDLHRPDRPHRDHPLRCPPRRATPEGRFPWSWCRRRAWAQACRPQGAAPTRAARSVWPRAAGTAGRHGPAATPVAPWEMGRRPLCPAGIAMRRRPGVEAPAAEEGRHRAACHHRRRSGGARCSAIAGQVSRQVGRLAATADRFGSRRSRPPRKDVRHGPCADDRVQGGASDARSSGP